MSMEMRNHRTIAMVIKRGWSSPPRMKRQQSEAVMADTKLRLIRQNRCRLLSE